MYIFHDLIAERSSTKSITTSYFPSVLFLTVSESVIRYGATVSVHTHCTVMVFLLYLPALSVAITVSVCGVASSGAEAATFLISLILDHAPGYAKSPRNSLSSITLTFVMDTFAVISYHILNV